MHDLKKVFLARWHFAIQPDIVEKYVEFVKQAPNEISAFAFFSSNQFLILLVSTNINLDIEDKIFSSFNQHPLKKMSISSVIDYFKVQKMHDEGKNKK